METCFQNMSDIFIAEDELLLKQTYTAMTFFLSKAQMLGESRLGSSA